MEFGDPTAQLLHDSSADVASLQTGYRGRLERKASHLHGPL
jgi:hypothetical protein